MCSELKYATQIYVNPIYFEVQLIFRNDQNWWNRKNCRNSFIGYFLRSEFKSPIKIYGNTIHFEIQLILRNDLFRIPGPDDQNRWNRKNCPKLFHRVIFVFWIKICNPNLCKSHIFWITANIEKWFFFAWKSVKLEKYPKILS